jgi:sugar O-acyltransferase (sialic acid O-acetyltransferase NeuD family)
MVRGLVIVGAGGHGREVLDVVEAVNAASVERSGEPVWRVLGFADDRLVVGEPLERLRRRGVEVVGTLDDVAGTEALVVVAVGDPAVRRDLVERAGGLGLHLAPALVHPSATLGGDVALGAGVVVAAGSQLTTNVRVGTGAQVNVGCSISHDVTLGDHVTLSPGCRLTGGVTVEAGSFFGVGALVAPGVRVGAGARVGAGSVVLHDVAPGTTVHGTPARPRPSGGPAERP